MEISRRRLSQSRRELSITCQNPPTQTILSPPYWKLSGHCPGHLRILCRQTGCAGNTSSGCLSNVDAMSPRPPGASKCIGGPCSVYSTNTRRGAEGATPWTGSLFSSFFRRLVRGILGGLEGLGGPALVATSRLALPVCQDCPKSRRKHRPKVLAVRIILPGPLRVTVVMPRITLLELIQRVFRISRDRAVLFFEYLQALRRDPLAAEDR